MTAERNRAAWMAACLMAAVSGLAGCADTPPAPAGTAVPLQSAGIVSSPQPGPGGLSGNDPSAPPDTPLCGLAARESNAMDRALLGRQFAEAGACTAYACYDAATATFIGADGYRHVCR